MSDTDTHPRTEIRDEFTVVGTEIRTTNDAESDSGPGPIGAHWHRFEESGLAKRAAGRVDPNVLYGVYTRYESDHRGAYSHLIAWEIGDGGEAPDGTTTVTIPSAKYLVFTGEGEAPEVVIRTWGEVWRYFEQESEVERAYTADFERYDHRKPSRVEIYVAVK